MEIAHMIDSGAVKAAIRGQQKAVEQAEMARAASVATSDQEAPAVIRRQRGRGKSAEPADFGPKVQHTNGRLVVNREATDPDRPSGFVIRRAMRSPHYDRMHRKRDITDSQREACDAYAMLTERLSGAKWSNGERVGVGRTEPAFRGSPTLAQVQASATLSKANATLGSGAADLIQLFVVQDLPIAELAARRKEREEITKGRVLAAIARLAEHWGMNDEAAEFRLTKPQVSDHR